jgi:hypothetical protein
VAIVKLPIAEREALKRASMLVSSCFSSSSATVTAVQRNLNTEIVNRDGENVSRDLFLVDARICSFPCGESTHYDSLPCSILLPIYDAVELKVEHETVELQKLWSELSGGSDLSGRNS